MKYKTEKHKIKLHILKVKTAEEKHKSHYRLERLGSYIYPIICNM